MKFPESISASIFSSAFSCFPPGLKSSSSSLSQASLSRRAMWAANFVNSFGGNWSIAFSISARLIKHISFRRTHSQAFEYPGRLWSGPPSNLDSDARSDGSLLFLSGVSLIGCQALLSGISSVELICSATVFIRCGVAGSACVQRAVCVCVVPGVKASKVAAVCRAKSYKDQAKNSGIHPDRQVASGPLILHAS